MRVERAAAEAGKMLAATYYSVFSQAGEKIARILHHALRSRRCSARAHYFG